MTGAYEPELGQALFGNAMGQCDPGEMGEACIRMVLEEVARVYGNRERKEWDSCYCTEDPGIPGFVVRPYWWGDCTCGADDRAAAWEEAHPHRDGCYQVAYGKLREAAGGMVPDADARTLCRRYGLPWNKGFASAVHCTCGVHEEWATWVATHEHAGDCRTVLPNLEAHGVRVRWYKYVGRGMTVERAMSPDDWSRWLDATLATVRAADVR